jgi:hypothetical protein
MEGQMTNGQPGSSGRDTQGSTEEFVQTAKDEADAVKEQARDAAAEIKEGARGVAEDVKEQVRASTAKQKDAAAQQIDGWAHALNTASDDLRDRGQESAAAWIRQAAAGLQRASGTMRERDIDDLFGTVKDFARRQPVAFLGGAVVAGFGLARLMKSSADRRHSTQAGSHFGEGRGTAAGARYGDRTGTAAGSRYGEEAGAAAERRFGEGAGTPAGTHYGEGRGL